MQKSTKKARYNFDESTGKMNDDEEITGDDFIAFGPSKLKNHGKNGNLQSGRGENDKEGKDEGIEEQDKYPPWYREKDVHSNGLKQLHNEILSFCDLVAPTLLEQYVRGTAMANVESQVKSLFPKSEIQYYGSQMTKLYLPESDIDVVIMNVENISTEEALMSLANSFRAMENIIAVEEILSATVPIVKLRFQFQNTQNDIMEFEEELLHEGIDFTTGELDGARKDANGKVYTKEDLYYRRLEYDQIVQIDLSVNIENGPATGRWMLANMEEIQPLRPIIIVLKYFLFQRDLAETFKGGMGSFLLQTLVLSMLQHRSRLTNYISKTSTKQTINRSQSGRKVAIEHSLTADEIVPGLEQADMDILKKACNLRNNALTVAEIKRLFAYNVNQWNANLGSILYEFLITYGQIFTLTRVGISIQNGGEYFERNHRFPPIYHRRDDGQRLCCESPLDPKVDIGRNSYAIRDVNDAFTLAADRLKYRIIVREQTKQVYDENGLQRTISSGNGSNTKVVFSKTENINVKETLKGKKEGKNLKRKRESLEPGEINSESEEEGEIVSESEEDSSSEEESSGEEEADNNEKGPERNGIKGDNKNNNASNVLYGETFENIKYSSLLSAVIRPDGILKARTLPSSSQFKFSTHSFRLLHFKDAIHHPKGYSLVPLNVNKSASSAYRQNGR